MPPTLILFSTPEQAPRLAALNGVSAPMVYRIGNGLTLHRSAAAGDLRGGILAIAGGTVSVSRGAGNLPRFLQQVQREALYRRVRGVWLEVDAVPQEQIAPLLTALDDLLGRMKLEFWVPEWCAPSVRRGNLLISSALSGGSLRGRLEEAVSAHGAARVTLAVEPVCEDFTLPASQGAGVPLTEEAFATLRAQVRPNVFYSTELCAHYFTYLRRGVPHFVLFDTPGSIQKKLSLAGTLGLRWAVVPVDWLPLEGEAGTG